MPLIPKTPKKVWLHSFIQESLQIGKAYSLTAHQLTHKLDQNESPFDWPLDLKKKVCSKLLETEWNRYPSPYSQELIERLADYTQVLPKHVIPSPGSNQLIGTLLNLFSHHPSGDIFIARPSFPLYESHCKFHNISYKTWDLDGNFQYQCDNLKGIKSGSVVFFASPNNPIGNALSYHDLEALLKDHPSSLFIADEAYYEFAEKPYTPLLEQYSNLIILRTLSKAMGSAGLRLGYVLASEEVINLIRKLTLPFMLNHFNIIAACELLQDENIVKEMQEKVSLIRQEREELKTFLQKTGEKSGFSVIPSQANFLLLKWQEQDSCQRIYQTLIKKNILLRDVSQGGGALEGCLRLTIGNKEENSYVKKIFSEI